MFQRSGCVDTEHQVTDGAPLSLRRISSFPRPPRIVVILQL